MLISPDKQLIPAIYCQGCKKNPVLLEGAICAECVENPPGEKPGYKKKLSLNGKFARVTARTLSLWAYHGATPGEKDILLFLAVDSGGGWSNWWTPTRLSRAMNFMGGYKQRANMFRALASLEKKKLLESRASQFPRGGKSYRVKL